MTHRLEHPVRGRPLEFFLGMFLGLAGLVILVSTVVLEAPDFAPRYLASHDELLVYAYAILMVVGGVSTVLGLWFQSRPTSTVLGRGLNAVGCFLMAGIAGTYAADLAWGELQSPRNTLLMAILTAVVVGGLVRSWQLIKVNRIVLNAVRSAVQDGGK